MLINIIAPDYNYLYRCYDGLNVYLTVSLSLCVAFAIAISQPVYTRRHDRNLRLSILHRISILYCKVHLVFLGRFLIYSYLGGMIAYTNLPNAHQPGTV